MTGGSKQYSLSRPRLVTLLVLLVVAAPIVVANLSRDEVRPQVPQVSPLPNLSYGWPLIWYECKFNPSSTPSGGGANARVNLDLVQWSGPRLAGNLAIWFVVLVITGAACEWLLRRYRPQFRFRPRFVTLIVLVIVAVPVVLANLSQDQQSFQAWWATRRAFPGTSAHGWPLAWYWCELKPSSPLPAGAVPSLKLDITRWSVSRLAGNLAIWLSMLAVIGAACQWPWRRHPPALSHRPRLLTPIVLIAVTGLIVLANLNYGQPTRFLGFERFPSFGWPLIWRWRNVYYIFGGTIGELDQNFSTARLTVNLAMWFGTLVAAGVACEWLLRRYRPRLRWSLRTMLAGVVLLAVFCAWCTALRDRADVQDPIISTYEQRARQVLLERWGPKWLDLFGADRFRRRVVGVFLNDSLADEDLIECLGRLPDLRYLNIDISQMGPGMAALGEVRQLRMLRIACGTNDEEAVHEALLAVGKLTRLERLWIDDCEVLRSDDLRCLRGLTRLKSLTLAGDLNEDAAHECLAAVGELTQIERLCLEGLGHVQSDDLASLARLTNLKSLTLESDWDEGTSHEWLAAIGKLTQLERLCLTGFYVRSNELACLAGLGNLRALGLRSYYWPDSSSVDGMEEEEDLTEVEGESTDKLENMDKLQLLVHLPALPRLETIDLNGSEVGDDDLAQLAVFPRLKSLGLTGTYVTLAGLAAMAPLESLEELAIDNSLVTSPAGLESLLALTHLKALHINSRSWAKGPTMSDRPIGLPLDNGQMLVGESEVDRCRQALEALRQSNTAIVIDSDTDVFNERRAPKSGSGNDALLYQTFYGW